MSVHVQVLQLVVEDLRSRPIGLHIEALVVLLEEVDWHEKPFCAILQTQRSVEQHVHGSYLNRILLLLHFVQLELRT